MKRVLFVSGPALGHVGRLLSIARALQDVAAAVEISFILPTKPAQDHGALLREAGFRTVTVPVTGKPDGTPPHRTQFADRLEAHLASAAPDVLVHDLNLARWLSVCRLPDIPTFHVTNIQDTALEPGQTSIERLFAAEAGAINAERAAKGLPRLREVHALYAGASVLVADPAPILRQYPALRPGWLACGACLWSADMPLPAALDGLADIFLVSMGSTGPRRLPAETLRRIADRFGCGAVVYAGSDAEAYRAAGLEHAYPMLATAQLARRTALAMTHGGSGSSYQMLLEGVPLVMRPGHPSQRLLAARIAATGAGYVLRDDEDPDSALAGADPGAMRRAAAGFVPAPGAPDGPVRAARAIAARL